MNDCSRDAASGPAPADRLLQADEGAAARVERRHGRSPFVLACDHASNVIPRRLASLGLDTEDLTRHIAWDIGALGVARRLTALLDAPLVWQAYSRLVIDCNRGPWAADFIPAISEHTAIAANHALAEAERRARIEEIFQPYHDAIAAVLDGRQTVGVSTALVAVHSFTPVFKGVPRPWHIGILANRDRRLSSLLLDDLRGQGDLCVGDNEPYAVGDLTDYTVPVHAEARGLPHVEIEIRQDLIADAAGEAEWAERLAGCLGRALDRMVGDGVLPATGL